MTNAQDHGFDTSEFRRHPNKEHQEKMFWKQWLNQMGRYRTLLEMLENAGNSQQATTILQWKKEFDLLLHQWETLSGHKLNLKENRNGGDDTGPEDEGTVSAVGEAEPEARSGSYPATQEDRT